jgi:hypothetical protein
MNLKFIVSLLVGATSVSGWSQTPKPFRPATDGIQDDLNPPAAIAFTTAELATPPVGQIQKSYLRDVNQLRTLMTATLAAVPAGAEGAGSPWFTKSQVYKSGLDTVASSFLQSDCFSLIPQLSAVLAARKSDAPEFALKVAGLANGFSTVLIHAVERHLIDQNATVSAENLASFCTVFSTSGFIAEGDWEGSPIPVDSAGIMILDAAAVVTHLKSRPWQEADQFLGNATAEQAFSRYAASGNGIAVLKTKYAANQATITAKWSELAAWVLTQRPPN